MKSFILACAVLAALLLDDGALAQDTTCQELDIVFVIDRSGSIRDNNPPGCQLETDCDNWFLMRQFVNNLIDAITPLEDTRFGAVVFGADNPNDGSFVVFDLTNDRSSAKMQITNLEHQFHSTATYRGIRIMRQDVFTESNDRLDVPNVAIVITDGVPTMYEGGNGEIDIPRATSEALAEAEAAIDQGIIMLAIGVTNNIVNSTIIGLASDGQNANEPVFGETYFISEDFSALDDLVNGIETVTCNIVVDKCRNPLDLVFVVDVAGTTSDANWQLVRAFMMDMIDELEIGTQYTRVGLIAVSETATHEFFLNTHSTADNVKNAINTVNFRGGSLDIVNGLNQVATQYSVTNGERATAVNVVVVILDTLPTNSDSAVLTAALNVQSSSSVAMYAVGVTEAVTSSNVLPNLASDPSMLNLNYFTATAHSNLDSLVSPMETQICAAVEPSPGDHT